MSAIAKKRRISAPKAPKAAKAAKKKGEKLPLIPSDNIQECATPKEVHALLATGDVIAAYCRLPVSGATRKEIEEAHVVSQEHMLINREDPTGLTGVIRNCTTLSTRFALQVLHLFPDSASAFIERGWCSPKQRFFQGCAGHDGIEEELKKGKFRMLTPDQIPGNAALYELPLVAAGENAILFCYAGARDDSGQPTNNANPHGIANGKSLSPRQWHAEPGGTVSIILTENTPTNSAGFYITTLNPQQQQTIYKHHRDRLVKEAMGKYNGIYDDTLLNKGDGLSIWSTNYIAVCANALPPTWLGNLISDPLTMKGNGAIHNRKKVSGPFKLPKGHITPDELKNADWPDGIRCPPDLYNWAVKYNYLFRTIFLDEAKKNPKNFLAFFPSFKDRTHIFY